MAHSLHRAARLAGLLFLLGLFTSRLTLLLHELVGHALPAAAVGADQIDVELFWFAGGYVSFPRAEPYGMGERLVISLGGIGLELVLAAVALWWSRRLRRPLASTIALGYATIVAVHACFYLATGAFHGYGDGWLLHRELGDARAWVALPAAAAAVAAAFLLGRAFARRVRGWLPERRPVGQLVLLFGAIAVAGGLHAALSYGEIHLRADRSYSNVMQHQAERDVARELARYLAQQRARGITPDRQRVAQVRAELRDAHEPFPLDITLGIAVGVAGLAGAVRARGTAGELPTWRDSAPLAGAIAALIAVIAVVSAL